MIKTIKNIQALSTFKQNRLSQKLSKLRVALVGVEVDISDQAMYYYQNNRITKIWNLIDFVLKLIKKYE
jgi:hypothetical protein